MKRPIHLVKEDFRDETYCGVNPWRRGVDAEYMGRLQYVTCEKCKRLYELEREASAKLPGRPLIEIL